MGTRIMAIIVLLGLLALILWGAAAIVGVTFWQSAGCAVLFLAGFHGLIKLIGLIVPDEAKRP